MTQRSIKGGLPEIVYYRVTVEVLYEIGKLRNVLGMDRMVTAMTGVDAKRYKIPKVYNCYMNLAL